MVCVIIASQKQRSSFSWWPQFTSKPRAFLVWIHLNWFGCWKHLHTYGSTSHGWLGQNRLITKQIWPPQNALQSLSLPSRLVLEKSLWENDIICSTLPVLLTAATLRPAPLEENVLSMQKIVDKHTQIIIVTHSPRMRVIWDVLAGLFWLWKANTGRSKIKWARVQPI